ncbi:MAG TPA: hypothetical protein VK843_20135 [Planctomycetota bacterium]|nr:hypothetical protein [Planctomycetota bacterium]
MSLTIRTLLCSLLALGVAAPLATTQSGGFTSGDLYFSILGPQQPFPDGGSGIARVDPMTGAMSVLLDMPANSTPNNGSMVYDAFRDRILFAGFPTLASPLGTWAVDAAGTCTLLHSDNNGWPALISPAPSGQVYYRFIGSIRYLDATNVEHTLMNSSGLAAYTAPWLSIATTMSYDAPSHSLIASIFGTSSSTCSGNLNVVVVRKLPLSADGSRVIGPESCNELQINNIGNFNVPCGLGRMPNGHLILPIDPNSSGIDPVFLEVDPASLAMSIYAVVDHAQNISLKFGGYSTARNAAFDVDIGAHLLRFFAAGGTGAGTALTTAFPISPGGNTPMAWMEIAGAGCSANNISTYCTAKVSSHGCVPWVATLGAPSKTLGSGFTIRANSTEAGKPGIFLYSTSGAAATVFQGGLLCIQPSIKRLAAVTGGGPGACTGMLSLDFNSVLASTTNPALIAGAQVWGQFWFRDPPATAGSGLSNALTFHICP